MASHRSYMKVLEARRKWHSCRGVPDSAVSGESGGLAPPSVVSSLCWEDFGGSSDAAPKGLCRPLGPTPGVSGCAAPCRVQGVKRGAAKPS